MVGRSGLLRSQLTTGGAGARKEAPLLVSVMPNNIVVELSIGAT